MDLLLNGRLREKDIDLMESIDRLYIAKKYQELRDKTSTKIFYGNGFDTASSFEGHMHNKVPLSIDVGSERTVCQKAISFDSGNSTVQRNKSEGNTSKKSTKAESCEKIEASDINIGSVLDAITTSSTGLISFKSGEGHVWFGSLTITNNRNCEDTLSNMKSYDKSNFEEINAAEGDYVLVHDYKGKFKRAEVICKLCSTYFVQLIDYGTVMSVKKVHACSDKDKLLMELRVGVLFNEKLIPNWYQCFSSILFEVEGEDKCLLNDVKDVSRFSILVKGWTEKGKETTIGKAKLFKPFPSLNMQSKTLSLNSNSSVVLITLTPNDCLYVKLCAETVEENMKEMFRRINDCVQTAGPFTSCPDKLYLTKYRDGYYYRVEEISHKDDIVSVFFVDLGIREDIPRTALKMLPREFHVVPYFAIEIKLHEVTLPFSAEAKVFIKKLIKEKTVLSANLKGLLPGTCLLRETNSGDDVNEIIQKKNFGEPEEGCLENSDTPLLTISPFTLTSHLVLLHITEEEFLKTATFWVGDSSSKNFIFVNSELQTRMNEYCSTEHWYKPQVGELCLAEFEGIWCRARTIEIHNDLFNVVFIDFGNSSELTAKCIRKIKPEFTEYPAVAFKAKLSGFEKFCDKSKVLEKLYRNLENNLNVCLNNVLVSKIENNVPVLAIPAIEEILSQ